MRAGLYARVSTQDQDVELQLEELREYAIRRGWTIREYVDQGHSGATASRPALEEMMVDARARRIDTIVVWKFDRFARSLSHLVRALEEFEALGVEFISLRESIDTSTPLGRLMFGLVGAMAEFERDLIRERVRAGMARAKRKGTRLGRQPVKVDMFKVKRLKDKGLSHRQIADRLGVSLNTLKRRMRDHKQETP